MLKDENGGDTRPTIEYSTSNQDIEYQNGTLSSVLLIPPSLDDGTESGIIRNGDLVQTPGTQTTLANNIDGKHLTT